MAISQHSFWASHNNIEHLEHVISVIYKTFFWETYPLERY